MYFVSRSNVISIFFCGFVTRSLKKNVDPLEIRNEIEHTPLSINSTYCDVFYSNFNIITKERLLFDDIWQLWQMTEVTISYKMQFLIESNLKQYANMALVNKSSCGNLLKLKLQK